MKVTVRKDRNLIIVNARNTQNENDVETIEITVPEEYEDFNKKIAFITDDGVVWDFIENNKYTLTNAITKYKKVKFYIWLTQDNKDFRSEERTIVFNKNQDANEEVTEEEISGFNRMINILEEEITEVTGLQEDLTNLINTVQTKLDNGDFIGPPGPQGEPGESYDDTEIKEEIADIKEEQTTQNTRIEELEEQVQELENNQLTGTATGQSIYIEDSTNAKVRDIGLSGNSEQESTTGKNLFDKEATAIRSGTEKIVLDTGIRVKQTVEGQYKYLGIKIGGSELLGKQITFGGKITPSASNVGCAYLYYGNQNNSTVTPGNVSVIGSGNKSTTATLLDEFPANCDTVWLLLYSNRDGTGNINDYIDYTDFMFVIGSALGEYEPYTGGQASPNPSYPQEIHSTGDSGSVNEKVQNKNFLGLQDIAQTTALGLTYSVKNGKITINGTASSGGIEIPLKSPINCKNGTNYVLSKVTSGTSSNNNFNIQLRSNGVNIKQPTAQSLPVIYNDLSDTIDAIRLYVGSGYVFTNYTLELQIEQGITATDYVAHAEQDISFPLAQGQKLMQGDYLADDGIHHVRGEIVLDGSIDEGWTRSGTNTSNQYRFSSSIIANTVKKPSSGSDVADVLCSHFIKESADQTYSKNNGIAIHPNGNIFIFDDSFKEYTTEEFKAVLSQNPITLQYPLAEEVIDPYTEEQQAVWEQIKALRTYKPVTHISSTDEVPATVDVTYVKDLETVINNLGGA